jgi:hypothetical protein
MTLNFLDAFGGQISDNNEATHVLFKMVIFVLAGASLLAAISSIRNWLLRSA